MDDREVKLDALYAELDEIHKANREYWALKHYSQEASAAYQRRIERVAKIREGMKQLAGENHVAWRGWR